MVTPIRRISAVLAILTLFVGNAALCGGWQSTPEARMACCTSGATCPMHKSGAGQKSANRVVSQAQADGCCAASSTRTQSSTADPVFVSSAVTPLPVAASLVVPVAVPALQRWRTLAPLPVSPVPKHLLLSTLLI